MDFRQEFKSSFIRLPALGAGMSEYSLLGEVYGSTPDHTVGDMISVLAHSSITCQPPFSYHIRSLGCYDQRKRYVALRKPDARVKREDPFVF